MSDQACCTENAEIQHAVSQSHLIETLGRSFNVFNRHDVTIQKRCSDCKEGVMVLKNIKRYLLRFWKDPLFIYSCNHCGAVVERDWYYPSHMYVNKPCDDEYVLEQIAKGLIKNDLL